MSEGLGRKGEFRLLHKIGEGGMADVFLAERMGDDGFRTRVALKRLHRGLAMDSYFIRQLVREARLLGQLEHANIVKVFDLRHIGDEYYVVMEYVDGIDLEAVARVHRRRKTRIPRPFFFHVALSLSEALAYAHSAVDTDGNPTPLIHRDLKPSNVMLSRRGIVKLTDFGIAHVGDGSVTEGMVQGTANYMSPEQAFGDERLTPASDVYSLGAVFYEMLTGRGLVDADNYLKAIHQVRQCRVTVDELAEVGVEPGLRMVIAKMLSADVDQRYQEMDSVRNDLQFVADRLKIDLSWHRIRSYVGRLMGILGRAPDRATLSNLKVATEYSSGAEDLGAEVSTSPPVPDGSTPDSIALRKEGPGPVTRAVQKDLLNAEISKAESEREEELLIGAEPGAGRPIGEGAADDSNETVAISGVQVAASDLLGGALSSSAGALPPSAGVAGLDESTAVASSESWAAGADLEVSGGEMTGSSAAEDGEHQSNSGFVDEEITQVYQGQTARETGVLGTGASAETPAPSDRGAVESVSQLGPNLEEDDTDDDTLPPDHGEADAPPSGSMWVFNAASGAELDPQPELADPPAPSKRRRRRRKKKGTVRVLVAMFVVALGAALVILILVMKRLAVPPFDAPEEVSAEVDEDSDPAPAPN